MMTRERSSQRDVLGTEFRVPRLYARTCSSGLYLVDRGELLDLEKALNGGRIPPDLERKLRHLHEGGMLERFVERNCQLFLSLLSAREQGSFREADASACDRLLQVLAYVRKDEDAVPDYRPGGFKDDAQEVRLAIAELEPVIRGYKTWHLRHQVPGIWLRAAAQLDSPMAAPC